MDSFDDIERRIIGKRQLNAFDQEAVETVAVLIARAREAERIIRDAGPIASNDRGVPIEHPAVRIERGASAELRGWVKDRPDLFGEQHDADAAKGNGLRKFRVVD